MRTERKLTITATRNDKSPLSLRQGLCELENDELKVDAAVDLGGAHLIVNVKRKAEKGWVTYVLPLEDVMRRVLEDDDAVRVQGE